MSHCANEAAWFPLCLDLVQVSLWAKRENKDVFREAEMDTFLHRGSLWPTAACRSCTVSFSCKLFKEKNEGARLSANPAYLGTSGRASLLRQHGTLLTRATVNDQWEKLLLVQMRLVRALQAILCNLTQCLYSRAKKEEWRWDSAVIFSSSCFNL